MDEQVQERLACLFADVRAALAEQGLTAAGWRQQGVGGPVRELVLFGRDTSRIARRYFDPEAGTVREAFPTM